MSAPDSKTGLCLVVRRAMRARTASTCTVLCLGLGAWLVARAAEAAGASASAREHEMILSIDSRWVGCSEGGYYPIRIRATNLAEPRTLQFRFVDTGGAASRLPTVERRLLIGKNATQQFTLSVPMVSHSSYGELRVLEEGSVLDGLTQRLSLPRSDASLAQMPSLLVIHPSPATVDLSQFDEGAQALATSLHTLGRRWSGSSYSTLGACDMLVLEPTLLPDSWIDYTGLDIVAAPLATFDKLPAAVRNAVIEWTEAGGTLVLYSSHEPAEKSRDVARLLELENRRALSPRWQVAPVGDHQPVVAYRGRGRSRGIPGLGASSIEAAGGENPNPAPPEVIASTSVWSITPETFSRLDLFAGRVFVFVDDPFPGGPVDWAWWLASADWQKTMHWTTRVGTSSRRGHPQFFDFLIPGVGAVPIMAFVGLITIFAVVIGPVNYFLLWKRKQLYLLIVTIPAIALLTSAALFTYAVIADGFSVQSRLRTVTILDQGKKHAVAFSRASLYAGLATSAGLSFSPETAVFPVWPDDTGLETGTVDWTDTQELRTGWLRSRTPAQFETIAVRDERGRLEVAESTAPGMALEVSNGLEWTLDALVVRDSASRLYFGRDFPPGASRRLPEAQPSELESLARDLAEESPAPPEGMAGANAFGSHNPRSMARMQFSSRRGPPMSFDDSIMESLLRQLERLDHEPDDGGLPRRSYAALVRENPGIELGVSQTRASKGVHVLLGYY